MGGDAARRRSRSHPRLALALSSSREARRKRGTRGTAGPGCSERALAEARSAREVQDGVGGLRFLVEDSDGLPGREDHELHVAARRLVPHLVHHWKGAGRSRSDHETAALPRDLLTGGERRMAERVAERSGGFLLPLPD